MADFPKWLVVDEDEPVHVTLTPADAVATIGMLLLSVIGAEDEHS